MKNFLSSATIFSTLLMYGFATETLEFQPQNIPLEQPSLILQDIEIAKPMTYKQYKNVGIATALSIVPGLGHVYLGDMQTGGALMGSFGLEVGLASAAGGGALSGDIAACALNTWFYGMYAGYRDARIYNDQMGYKYRMPKDSLADLTMAPFSWSVIKKPEVWGGVLGMFAGAAIVGSMYNSKSTHDAALSSNGYQSTPLIAFPVGIGEEAFFRGLVQSQAIELFKPAGGIAFASIYFGAAHYGNTFGMSSQDRRLYCQYVMPFLAASGAYMGWLSYKNGSLKESVAVHAWYDFIIFSLASVASQSITGEPATFAIQFAF
jgi:membrane protease YdiL (CAAX protease family)